jgi:hypothetical protein
MDNTIEALTIIISWTCRMAVMASKESFSSSFSLLAGPWLLSSSKPRIMLESICCVQCDFVKIQTRRILFFDKKESEEHSLFLPRVVTYAD